MTNANGKNVNQLPLTGKFDTRNIKDRKINETILLRVGRDKEGGPVVLGKGDSACRNRRGGYPEKIGGVHQG